jgi:hypothetical protein
MEGETNKGGRPSLYTTELIERICERLETGEPMAQICRDDGMPAYRTVKDWIDGKPDVSAAIARAREIGFDAIAQDTLTIADDGRNDFMERLAADGDEKAQLAFNAEHVQRSRLRVDTRLKLLAKWDPKRYGDKLALGGAEDLPPMQTITKIERTIVRKP